MERPLLTITDYNVFHTGGGSQRAAPDAVFRRGLPTVGGDRMQSNRDGLCHSS